MNLKWLQNKEVLRGACEQTDTHAKDFHIFTLAKFRTPIFANCTIFIWNVLECQLHSIFTNTRKVLTCGYDISKDGMRRINSPTRVWKRCTGPDRTCIWRNQFISSIESYFQLFILPFASINWWLSIPSGTDDLPLELMQKNTDSPPEASLPRRHLPLWWFERGEARYLHPLWFWNMW